MHWGSSGSPGWNFPLALSHMENLSITGAAGDFCWSNRHGKLGEVLSFIFTPLEQLFGHFITESGLMKVCRLESLTASEIIPGFSGQQGWCLSDWPSGPCCHYCTCEHEQPTFTQEGHLADIADNQPHILANMPLTASINNFNSGWSKLRFIPVCMSCLKRLVVSKAFTWSFCLCAPLQWISNKELKMWFKFRISSWIQLI